MSTHSKYKNSAILFEILTRKLTSDIMEGNNESDALKLIQEFFKPNTELGKELSLYKTLISSNRLSENRASKLIDMIAQQRSRINNKKLNEQKYNLIKKIKETYPLKEFLAINVPQYKIYASIYKTLLAECRPNSIAIDEIADVANARFALTEYLMKTPPVAKKDTSTINSFKEQTQDVRLIAHKILIDRFNKKYSSLDSSQKNLLREYIYSVANTTTLKEYINSEIEKIQKNFGSRLTLMRDQVRQIKLKEVITQLNVIKESKTVYDNHVSALMIAYELLKELDERY